MNYFKKLVEFKTSLTFSPHCFLPMIVADEESSNQIMGGVIPLAPMVKSEEQKQLLDNLKQLVKNPGNNSVNNGFLCDTSDLKTLSLSLYPLEFDGVHYKKNNFKFSQIGDTTIIILYSQIFLTALYQAIARTYPHLRILEVSTAQYKPVSNEVDSWDLFARPKSNKWKREIYAMARIRHGIATTDDNITESPEFVSIDG